MTAKSFEERLAELIADEFTFPGNSDAAFETVVSALELQLMAVKEQEKEFKEELEK